MSPTILCIAALAQPCGVNNTQAFTRVPFLAVPITQLFVPSGLRSRGCYSSAYSSGGLLLEHRPEVEMPCSSTSYTHCGAAGTVQTGRRTELLVNVCASTQIALRITSAWLPDAVHFQPPCLVAAAFTLNRSFRRMLPCFKHALTTMHLSRQMSPLSSSPSSTNPPMLGVQTNIKRRPRAPAEVSSNANHDSEQ